VPVDVALHRVAGASIFLTTFLLFPTICHAIKILISMYQCTVGHRVFDNKLSCIVSQSANSSTIGSIQVHSYRKESLIKEKRRNEIMEEETHVSMKEVFLLLSSDMTKQLVKITSNASWGPPSKSQMRLGKAAKDMTKRSNKSAVKPKRSFQNS
jgi:hypothetical protein